MKIQKHFAVCFADQNTKREQGRKVQLGNVQAGKVDLLLLFFESTSINAWVVVELS